MTARVNSSSPIVSIHDYMRPWKLFSLGCGIVILVIGSFIESAMDWDVSISFIMAIATYIFAPITSRTVFISRFRRQWQYWLLAIFGLWFAVDGVYLIYWTIKDAEVVGFMRDANFKASLFLYLLCAFIWLHDGSLKELFDVDK